MVTTKIFLLLALGLILAPTGESLLIGHHRVLKNPDFYTPDPVSLTNTLGQNQTFYPEITKNLMFENVNFVKSEIFKM